MRMDTLSPLERDCDYRDVDGTRYADAGTDFDGSFNTRLQHVHVSITEEWATDGGEGEEAHQSSRDARVSNEEVCVRTPRHTHKSGHLLTEIGLER